MINPSYEAGLRAGLITRLYNNKNFKRNAVGRLSRLCCDRDGVIAFTNKVIEKLVLQDKIYPNIRVVIYEFTQIVHQIDVYDKPEFLRGFFDSYMKPFETQN